MYQAQNLPNPKDLALKGTNTCSSFQFEPRHLPPTNYSALGVSIFVAACPLGATPITLTLYQSSQCVFTNDSWIVLAMSRKQKHVRRRNINFAPWKSKNVHFASCELHLRESLSFWHLIKRSQKWLCRSSTYIPLTYIIVLILQNDLAEKNCNLLPQGTKSCCNPQHQIDSSATAAHWIYKQFQPKHAKTKSFHSRECNSCDNSMKLNIGSVHFFFAPCC